MTIFFLFFFSSTSLPKSHSHCLILFACIALSISIRSLPILPPPPPYLLPVFLDHYHAHPTPPRFATTFPNQTPPPPLPPPPPNIFRPLPRRRTLLSRRLRRWCRSISNRPMCHSGRAPSSTRRRRPSSPASSTSNSSTAVWSNSSWPR